MNILVTGGAGYIGTHTCVELLEKGHDIIVLDNFYNSNPEAIRRVKEITGREFKFYQCDVRDSKGLSKIFGKESIGAVIHFAGLKAVGESVEIPLDYYENNVGGTVALLQVMKQFGIKSIVFSSSATVYGGNNPVPYKEDMPIGGCTNPYGQTKYMIELILNDLYVSDPAWNVIILRYFNPVGAHESGRIGENPNGVPNNLMPSITQAAVGKLDKFTLFGGDYDTPDGTCIRDYIHVTDLADGHVKALNKLDAKGGLRVYNLGTGRGTSVLEMLAAFETASGVKVPVAQLPRRAGDLAVCYANVDKARTELGFTAKYGLERMCVDSWRWQRENPRGMLDEKQTIN
ncbi:MAG: UDP-glucose 4-epimerase GalE [Clostridiales bacterium]|jgi:UDP-glucose 4-epimerase|nr:UDP-glucose 4-epimerase GalE [Clostridiales bacterium]